jgi:hypothetical protein
MIKGKTDEGVYCNGKKRKNGKRRIVRNWEIQKEL